MQEPFGVLSHQNTGNFETLGILAKLFYYCTYFFIGMSVVLVQEMNYHRNSSNFVAKSLY